LNIAAGHWATGSITVIRQESGTMNVNTVIGDFKWSNEAPFSSLEVKPDLSRGV
jgi:hypothetical protein